MSGLSLRAGGRGFSPGYYECGPRLLLPQNRRKIEPKEIPSCLIPRLLAVFTRQLEILVTTLHVLARIDHHTRDLLPLLSASYEQCLCVCVPHRPAWMSTWCGMGPTVSDPFLSKKTRKFNPLQNGYCSFNVSQKLHFLLSYGKSGQALNPRLPICQIGFGVCQIEIICHTYL